MDIAWIPIVAGACVGAAVVGIRRRARARLRAAEARAAKERERASIAERELAAERGRMARMADGVLRPLASLSSGRQEMSDARDAQALARALAAALELLLDPSQVMVFLAADSDGKEFVLAATAGRGAAAWPLGARLSDTTGRLGLVARRRVVMDEREFAAESEFVREQVEATEPAAFMCEIAAPVVADDVALAVVSVGGSTLPFDATRDGVEFLASHAATVMRRLAGDVVSGRREFAPAASR